MKTGVIVGRLQVDDPHAGHCNLIDRVQQESDILVFVLGESPTRLTTRHPLPFEARKEMLKERYPSARVVKLEDTDTKELAAWCWNLDELLTNLGYPNITLYGGRDSFLNQYHGKFPTKELICEVECSGTERREAILKYPTFNKDFRAGMIYAANYKFPTVYPTVDILVYSNELILLGRKPKETAWRFPGGFVDTKDSSLEEAARRELSEEAPNIVTNELKYLVSAPIDDWRYKESNDGIMTSLFVAEYVSGNLVAGDDLEELRWWYPDEAMRVIADLHLPLLKNFLRK